MEPLQPLNPGDRFQPSASWYNATIEVIKEYFKGRQREQAEGPDFRVVQIQNKSGLALHNCSIVGIGEILVDPADSTRFKSSTGFESAAPTAAGLFAVLQEPARIDGFANAVMSGETWALVSVSNSSHTFAKPINGDYDKLQSQAAAGPARIVWKEDGTGVKWAYILIDPNHTSGSSGGTILTDSGTATGPDYIFAQSGVITISATGSTVTFDVDGVTSLTASLGVEVNDEGSGLWSIAGIPYGDTGATTVGMLSNTTQTIDGAKTFTGQMTIHNTGVDGGGNSVRIFSGTGSGSDTVADIYTDGAPYDLAISVVNASENSVAIGFNADSGTIFVDASASGVAVESSWGVHDSYGLHTGAWATVSGLVFKGGLYISGSLSASTVTGTTTNDNAAAGDVGEYVSSIQSSGSASSLTTATAANITSISLTAGDWDVEGYVTFTGSAADISALVACATSTSATIPTDGTECQNDPANTGYTGSLGIAIPRKRFSLASTTTIYLVGKATFSAGSVSAYGQITARRMR